MGQVICPNGSSVHCDKINGSVPFEYLVRDMKFEHCTDEYRVKCIEAIGCVGLFNYTKEIGIYLHQLMAETESEILKSACKSVISKYKIRKKRTQLLP